MNQMLIGQRLFRLRQKMRSLDALLITRPENCTYLSGFEGDSAVLLITRMYNFLITDFRYLEQAAAQAPLFQIMDQKGPVEKCLAEVMQAAQIRTVGFESDHLTCRQFGLIKNEAAAVEFHPAEGLAEDLRLVKDAEELILIRRAEQIGDEAFNEVLGFIRPGISERDVAVELAYQMQKRGASKLSFNTIVASGVRGSLPHGEATDKIIESGELVTMDFGCVFAGYCSDMTRTVAIGKADDKQKEIYNIVLDAQLTGVAAVKSGAKASEVDKVARDVIAAAGYGEYFGHSLGHGVGLEVHELPNLSPKSTYTLEPDMTVTVEPGIYIPGWGGVRIEDLVMVGLDGCELLSRSPKELIEIE